MFGDVQYIFLLQIFFFCSEWLVLQECQQFCLFVEIIHVLFTQEQRGHDSYAARGNIMSMGRGREIHGKKYCGHTYLPSDPTKTPSCLIDNIHQNLVWLWSNCAGFSWQTAFLNKYTVSFPSPFPCRLDKSSTNFSSPRTSMLYFFSASSLSMLFTQLGS